MNSFFVIFKKEYLQRVRSLTFWLSTLLVPIFMCATIVIPIIFSKESKMEVAMVDQTQQIYPLLKKVIETSKHRLNIFLADTENLEILKNDVLHKKYHGYIVIPKDVILEGIVYYYGRNLADTIGLSLLESFVNRAVIGARMKARGISEEEANILVQKVRFSTFKITKEGEREDKGASYMISLILFLSLYMIIIMYGTFILRSVLEEKSTRIVEILITSIRPFSLMMGKIIGLAAVGLSQYLIWAAMGVAGFLWILPNLNMTAEMGVPQITASQTFFFVIFFILGYLMYSTLYAGVGAMFNSEQEANQMASVFVIPMVIPVVLMQVVMGDPNGTLSVILSLIPLFTPLLMYLRMLVETPPVWQVALGIILSIFTVILFTYISGKIYRVGILMTGKKPTFKDLYRWLKA